MITQLIVINSLICIGFYKACKFEESDDYDAIGLNGRKLWEGLPHQDGRMFLWWFRYYLGKWLNNFWSKPFYSCPPCMASVHSILPFVLMMHFYHLPTDHYLLWPFYALAVCGLNTLIINTIEI